MRPKDKAMNVRKCITAAMMSLFVSPGLAEASDCKWQATIAPPPQMSDFLRLTVKGVCQEPTPGYTLTLKRVNLAQPDPSTLILALDVVPPEGDQPQIATPTSVEYGQAVVLPMPAPTKVIVWETAATINIDRAK
jgi:hypothetical protein